MGEIEKALEDLAKAVKSNPETITTVRVTITLKKPNKAKKPKSK